MLSLVRSGSVLHMITRYIPPFRSQVPPQWRGACAAVAGGNALTIGTSSGGSHGGAGAGRRIVDQGAVYYRRGSGTRANLSATRAMGCAHPVALIRSASLASSSGNSTMPS